MGALYIILLYALLGWTIYIRGLGTLKVVVLPNLAKHFKKLIGHNFCKDFLLTTKRVYKKSFFEKKRIPEFKTRTPNARPSRGRGCNPPCRFCQLSAIKADYCAPAQLPAPLGGGASLRASAPPKGTGRSPRVRRWSRILDRRRSERTAAD